MGKGEILKETQQKKGRPADLWTTQNSWSSKEKSKDHKLPFSKGKLESKLLTKFCFTLNIHFLNLQSCKVFFFLD